MNEEERERKAREREEHQRQLEYAARVALSVEGAKPLVEELRRIAMGNAYAQGRNKADMAFADGKRATAVHLLKLGGIENG
ncbi:MAG: hypothetical protein ACLFWM_10865 [Actinomycetota bacterium]